MLPWTYDAHFQGNSCGTLLCFNFLVMFSGLGDYEQGSTFPSAEETAVC